MAIFFIFSMLLGVSLQITNGFANPYIQTYGQLPEFTDTFGAQHANILISISQISETCCILLIPFFYEAFWNQNRYANSNGCLGFPFWTFWYRRSREWRLDVYTFYDCLWCGLRLL